MITHHHQNTTTGLTSSSQTYPESTTHQQHQQIAGPGTINCAFFHVPCGREVQIRIPAGSRANCSMKKAGSRSPGPRPGRRPPPRWGPRRTAPHNAPRTGAPPPAGPPVRDATIDPWRPGRTALGSVAACCRSSRLTCPPHRHERRTCSTATLPAVAARDRAGAATPQSPASCWPTQGNECSPPCCGPTVWILGGSPRAGDGAKSARGKATQAAITPGATGQGKNLPGLKASHKIKSPAPRSALHDRRNPPVAG